MKNLLFIAITAFLVWLMIKEPYLMLNPGKLTAVHQELSSKCTSCHDVFWGISTEKCIECHKLSEIGKDSLGNTNSVLFHENLKNQACTSCHTDHKGINSSISLSKFNHGLFPLTEQTNCNSCHTKPTDQLHRPLSNACNECHTTNDWKSTTTFNHNMIQDSTKNNCITCHQSPNDNLHSNFKNNCTSCHNTNKWTPANFEHSKYFVLDKKHNAKCTTCHTTSNYKNYTCYGCHEHSERKIMSEHQEEGITNFNNCVKCHRSGNEHDIIYNNNSSNENSNDKRELKNHIESNHKEKGKKKKHDDD